MTLVQRSTEKPVLNTRLHNRENRAARRAREYGK